MAAALRVVSWNIRAAIGPGPFPDRWWSRIDADRLRAIGAFLAALDADVIALQEAALIARNGDLVDNAGDLARQLGMELRYGATRTFHMDAVVGHDDGAGTPTHFARWPGASIPPIRARKTTSACSTTSGG